MENRNIIAIVHTLSCGQLGVRHRFDVENVCCAFSTQKQCLAVVREQTNRDDLSADRVAEMKVRENQL